MLCNKARKVSTVPLKHAFQCFNIVKCASFFMKKKRNPWNEDKINYDYGKTIITTTYFLSLPCFSFSLEVRSLRSLILGRDTPQHG